MQWMYAPNIDRVNNHTESSVYTDLRLNRALIVLGKDVQYPLIRILKSIIIVTL